MLSIAAKQFDFLWARASINKRKSPGTTQCMTAAADEGALFLKRRTQEK